MKVFNRLVALCLSVLLPITMVMTAMADNRADTWAPESGDSITITGTNGKHTYQAFRIFSGMLAERQTYMKPAGYTGDDDGYPVFSFEKGNVKVYRIGDVYHRLADGSVYTPAATDTPVPVKDQSLQNIKWGEGLTDAGKLAVYTLVTDTATTGLPSPVAEGTHEGKYHYVRTYKDSNGITQTVDEYADTVAEWIEGVYPAEDVAAIMRVGSFTDAKAIELADFIVYGGKIGTVTYPSCLSSTATGSAKAATGADSVTIDLDGKQGYYLVKDKEDLSATDNDAYTRFMLRVVGEVTVAPKSSLPQVEKKVYEDSAFSTNGTEVPAPAYNSAHTNSTAGAWNDVADYNIGDTVPFMLVGTLPTTFEGYRHYRMHFDDVLANGFTYNTGTMRVYIVNATGELVAELAKGGQHENGYTQNDLTFSVDGGAVNVVLKDLRSSKFSSIVNAGCKIVVEYSATLNQDANLGSVGNVNDVVLHYSNNPNWDGEPEKDPTGTTVRDQVVVYTYQLEVTKEAQQSKEGVHETLAGAHFVLFSVDHNKYAIVDNRQTIDKKNADGSVEMDATGSPVQVPNPKYMYVTGWSNEMTDANVVVTHGDGKVGFKGLDDGAYQLIETQAPSGYNKLEKPIEFKVVANIENTNHYTVDAPASVWNGKSIAIVMTGTFNQDTVKGGGTGTNGDGLVKMTVENRGGAQLPVTGGLGTKMIYMAGAMLALGAGIQMITRKRLENEE